MSIVAKPDELAKQICYVRCLRKDCWPHRVTAGECQGLIRSKEKREAQRVIKTFTYNNTKLRAAKRFVKVFVVAGNW